VHGKRISVGGRLLAINGLALTSSRNGFPAVRATVAANAFLAPNSEGATAGATPAAPTGAAPAAPAKGASGTSSPAPATAITPTR
jgi:hypothetical protein